MKRTLHKLFLTILVTTSVIFAKAQNQEYFREGFMTINTATTAPAGPSDVVRRDTTATSPNTWVSYGAYRTTGTACTAGTTQHIRFTVNVTVDTQYLVTPYVNFGIKEFHFMRSRAARRFTIYKTYDTLGTTNNWILVTTTPSSPNTCANGFTDTTIMINDPLAKRLKINNTSLLDADIDSVWLTSVNAILPVQFAGFSGVAASGKVKLNWNIATEMNTSRYSIERSSSGSSFSEIATLPATQSASYTWIDNAPDGSDNFYRIRAIDKDGSSLYTSVVKISLSKLAQTLTVSPNPVVGQIAKIQLNNFNKGSYLISLLNDMGQQIYLKSIVHVGGSSTYELQLPSVKAGVYNLQLKDGETVINKRVVVQ